MSIKTYDLTEAERRELFSILEAALQRRPVPLSISRQSYFRDLFSNEHPVDQEIVGRPAIIDFLKERGCRARMFDALMQFTWSHDVPRWSAIIDGLNDFQVVEQMLRVPNIGTVTVRDVLQLCIAHGWIRNRGARKVVDRYLAETAPKRKAD